METQRNRIFVGVSPRPRLLTTFHSLEDCIRTVLSLLVAIKISDREVDETITALLFVVGTIPVNYQN